MSSEQLFDPWTQTRTRHGLPADEVISALQKEIRRAHAENAALLAYEMFLTGPGLEAKLWERLLVISVEDVGFGEPQAPVLIHALYRMHETLEPRARDRALFAVHAVRYLCRCPKDRSSDEMVSWMKRSIGPEGVMPVIPDCAADMHTNRGKQLGRGLRHFLEEGSQVEPELPGRDTTYRKRLLEIVRGGEES